MTTSPEEEGRHKTEPELADTTQLILQESHLFAAAGLNVVKMDQITPQLPVTADVRQQPNAAYVPGRMGQSYIGMPIPSLMRTLDLMPWVPGTLGVYRVLQTSTEYASLVWALWNVRFPGMGQQQPMFAEADKKSIVPLDLLIMSGSAVVNEAILTGES